MLKVKKKRFTKAYIMSLSPPFFVITPLFNKFADMSDEPVKGTKIEKLSVSWYLLALEPVSSSDSSRVITGSRTCKEMRRAPLVAILALVGKGEGEGEGRVGVTFDLAGEPRPQLHEDVWGLQAGQLDALQNTE